MMLSMGSYSVRHDLTMEQQHKCLTSLMFLDPFYIFVSFVNEFDKIFGMGSFYIFQRVVILLFQKLEFNTNDEEEKRIQKTSPDYFKQDLDPATPVYELYHPLS